MLRQNDSPDKAVQFSNLYARLLTQPVLSQKWGILYLLHQLANPAFESEEGVQNGHSISTRRDASIRDSRTREKYRDPEGSVFKDAFATDGLRKLPAHEDRVKNMSDDSGPAERRPRTRDTKSAEMVEDENPGPDLTAPASEAALLRDLPFTLQGLSTTNLHFSSLATLDLPPNLPLTIISLLHTLAEPSLLYRCLSNFIQSRDEGLIGQSLRSAIGSELRSYLGLISTLEGEIRRAVVSPESNEPKGRISKTSVTLKRCVIWTREATMGLRLMSLMVEESQSMFALLPGP